MENISYDFLVEWTINFIKNKDINTKNIEEIQNGKDGFDLYVKYKDREQYYIIAAELADIDSVINKIKNNIHISIITLNSKNNFDAVLKKWNKLADFKFLSILFVNPFSKLDEKWGIFPYTHNKICDQSSLEQGLKSMFETVEII